MQTESHKPASSQAPRFSLRALLIVVTLTGLLAAVFSYLYRKDAREKARLAELFKLDKKTTAEIVTDVEAIRVKLGRAPKDEAEVEAILGRPMPVVHDYGHPTPIFYHRTGKNSFKLQYELWDTDDWVYDSTAPQAGWVQHWY